MLPRMLHFPELLNARCFAFGALLKKRRYKNSPITEAVVDIRLGPSPSRSPDALLPIHSEILAEYPQKTEIQKLEGKFTIGQPVTQSQSLIGFRYDSVDKKYVFQARVDGFTLSRLQPYEHWEPFKKEAQRLWTIYRRYADPLHCIRAAVRYINRIDLPAQPEQPAEMKDYFRTYPEVSADLPQLLAGHLMQLLIPHENDTTLSLIQASVPPPRPGVASVNLDLDLFKESPTAFATDEQIWLFFDSLREVRDHIFESCITDKARALFEPVEA
jgi:uncharacterized protein (TIGR04255 family)